jgi:hypothetical protein
MNKRKIKKTIKKVLRNQQDLDALEEALFVLRHGVIQLGVRVVD